MNHLAYFQSLGDRELIAKLKSLVVQERRFLTELLACLSEMDRRKLYADEGFPSMFAYCVRALRYSENAAFRRIATARAARWFPEIFSYLSDGGLSLTAVSLLAPFLTAENHQELLARAEGKNKRELEWIIAGLSPQKDKADRIRIASPAHPEPAATEALATRGELPLAAPSASPTESDGKSPQAAPQMQENPAAPAPTLPAREKILPLAPKRVHFSFTGSEEFLNEVERARQLLWHKHPAGKLEDVFQEAIHALLEKKDPDRRIARKLRRPRSKSAPPPAWARR